MSARVIHAFVSTVQDENVEGEVGPDEWNDDHVITGAVSDSTQVIAGTGLTGGGALSGNVTLTLIEPYAAHLRVTGSTGTVGNSDLLVTIERAAPSTTGITLPAVANRSGRPVYIADYSSSVTGHTITLTPNGSEKIMRQSTWQLVSNTDSLANATLIPVPALSAWVIA